MTEEQKQALIEVQRYSVCEGWIVADEGGRLVTYEAFLALAQRAEAAEAKLAELAKQEPVGHFMLARDEDDSWWYEASEQNDKAIPLFTRPAPAADLVPEAWKMVPAEPTEEMIAAGDQFMDGLSRLGDAYEAMLTAAPTPPE